MSLRVASLDYLGIVAARLRKDAVTSKLNEKTIEEIIKQVCLFKSYCMHTSTNMDETTKKQHTKNF